MSVVFGPLGDDNNLLSNQFSRDTPLPTELWQDIIRTSNTRELAEAVAQFGTFRRAVLISILNNNVARVKRLMALDTLLQQGLYHTIGELNSFLYSAAGRQRADLVDYFIGLGAVNALMQTVFEADNTALHQAVLGFRTLPDEEAPLPPHVPRLPPRNLGDARRIMAAILAIPNVNVNAFDDYGNTALALAAREGLVEPVRMLLAHPGIDVAAHGEGLHANTPIAYSENHEITAMLRAAGA